MATVVGVVIAFTTGVLLAAAFLTRAGGTGVADLLLFAIGAAIVVLTVRTWRRAAGHTTARSLARTVEFGNHAAPQASPTDDTALPA